MINKQLPKTGISKTIALMFCLCLVLNIAAQTESDSTFIRVYLPTTATHPDEHMNYLLDNGYTEDAKRLFESQFSEGDAYRRQGNKWNTDLLYRPFAWRAGFNHGNDPVDQYLSLYFQEDARD